MGFVRSSAVRRLLFAASEHARESGWDVILPGHLVLAILGSDHDETVVARTAFERAELSEQAIRGILARGSRLDDQRAIGINVNPLTASILGQADGLAVGAGASETRPEHLVISIALTDGASLYGLTRTARQAALDSLSSDGVSVPATSVPEDRPPMGERIFVPRDNLREIVSYLSASLPAEANFGWNVKGNSVAWVVARAGFDLQPWVDEAVRHARTVDE